MTNSRRSFLKKAMILAGLGASQSLNPQEVLAEGAADVPAEISSEVNPNESRIALNTATILHFNLPLTEQITLAHAAGFRNLEIWFRDLDRSLAEGVTLPEIRSRLDDLGMRIVGGINFFQWSSPDEAVRQKALGEMRVGMEQMKCLGCTRFAAAPAGVHARSDVSLAELADRYRELLRMGDEFGVYPQLEIWGGGQTLSRLSDAVWIAAETGHPKASLLLDVYHLYRGGNEYASLLQLNGSQMTNFHWNDWPAGIEREQLRDADRVFPGDGVAPFGFIRPTLKQIGFQGTFSLEIFNKKYCETHTPSELLKIAYEKMRKAV